MVDSLAYAKLNVLHLHLTDEQVLAKLPGSWQLHFGALALLR